MRLFRDRHQAGLVLAPQLLKRGGHDPVLLAIPRGGVPLGLALQEETGWPLYCFVVERIRAGDVHGAISEGNSVYLPGCTWPLKPEVASRVAASERLLARRVTRYRGNPGTLPSLRDRCAVLVDDGVVSGDTAIAAIRGVRELGADSVIFVAPIVAPRSVCPVSHEADQLLCQMAPPLFEALPDWYEEFPDVTDSEIREALGSPTGDSSLGTPIWSSEHAASESSYIDPPPSVRVVTRELPHDG
ncbi:MAG: phosphoribosyltransferase family protein [Myxococcota bacterium]